jgi:hypothetical protein
MLMFGLKSGPPVVFGKGLTPSVGLPGWVTNVPMGMPPGVPDGVRPPLVFVSMASSPMAQGIPSKMRMLMATVEVTDGTGMPSVDQVFPMCPSSFKKSDGFGIWSLGNGVCPSVVEGFSVEGSLPLAWSVPPSAGFPPLLESAPDPRFEVESPVPWSTIATDEGHGYQMTSQGLQ